MPGRLAYSAYEGQFIINNAPSNCDASFNITYTAYSVNSAMIMVGDGEGNNYWNSAPIELAKKLKGRAIHHPPVVYLSTGTYGRYYCRFANGAAIWNTEGDSDLADLFLGNGGITCVAFGEDIGAYFVKHAGGTAWRGLNPHVEKFVRKNTIQTFAFNHENGGYVAIATDGTWYGTISEKARSDLRGVGTDEYVKSAWLGCNDTYLFHIVKRPRVPTSIVTIPDNIKTKSFGHKQYVGPLKEDGSRCGTGAVAYGEDFQWNWFVGEFVDGAPRKGIASASDGGIYSGECTNPDHATFNGWGSLSKGESWSSGQFKDGELHGVALQVYDDGRWTMGWFDKGKRHGRCLTFYSNTDTHRRFFLGEYRDDDYHTSAGKLAYMDGSALTGNVKDGKGSKSNAATGLNVWKNVIAAPSEVSLLDAIVGRAAEMILRDVPPTCYSRVDLKTAWRNRSEPGNETTTTRALRSFVRGLRLLKEMFGDGFAQLPSEGRFSWHGTKSDAVNEIIQSGFCTNQRERQNHGPGEYAATSWQAALQFSAPCSDAILCYSLPGPFLTAHESFCTVTCNPPSSKGVSFMLPVAVVSFTDAARKETVPGKRGVWQFLWEGTGTGSKWHPYHPVVNDKLTALSDAGGEHIVAVEQRRHDDSQKDVYHICLSRGIAHKQINNRTEYERAVKEFRKIPAYPTMQGEAPKPPVASIKAEPHEEEDEDAPSKQRTRK